MTSGTPKQAPSERPNITVLNRKPKDQTMLIDPTKTAPKYSPIPRSSSQRPYQPPPPHQYYTLVCDNNSAFFQQKHHDHFVHDAYSKMKLKRQRRILISQNSDSHLLTKYRKAIMKLGPRHQYTRNHKDNLLYDVYSKKKKNSVGTKTTVHIQLVVVKVF